MVLTTVFFCATTVAVTYLAVVWRLSEQGLAVRRLVDGTIGTRE